MKKDIHPKYFKSTKVQCSCSAKFEVGSTLEAIKVEVCSICHPLYTGEKRYLDAAGRLDRFKARVEKTKKMREAADRAKKAKRKKEKEGSAEKESESKSAN